MQDTLKVMSFNIRYAGAKDGINQFEYRKEGIARMLEHEQPDLIGFQETNDPIRHWLRDLLSDYIVVGCGRNADYHGESSLIAFKKHGFELLSFNSFWLSCTPNRPGSRYGLDQSSCSRQFGEVCLKAPNSQPFRFLCVHTDNRGKSARLLASVQLMQEMSSHPEKAILVGDLNALPDAEEIRLLSDCPDYPMKDATRLIPGSYHDYRELEPEQMEKIDYIFTNASCDETQSYLVPDEHPGGVFLSDHRPVVAFITVE